MRIKNTAKRLLAALLCALMVLSAFAVIPAMAEETSAATDGATEHEGSESTATGDGENSETTQDFSHLTGFDYLLAVSAAGGKVSFDDWVIPEALQTRIDEINNSSYTDATKATNIKKAYAPYVQDYLLSKTGIYLTDGTGATLSAATVTDERAEGAATPDYRINLFSSGHYANNALYSAGEMNFDQIIDKKLDGNAAFLGLLNGEVGPTKFSISMDFTFTNNFIGTAESNNGNLYAYTKHRGFSVIDFGGGWALKATAPGAGQITVKTDESGAPVMYNKDHTQNDSGEYYMVESVGKGTSGVGYLYSIDYNEQDGYVSYVFGANAGMGWSSTDEFLNTLDDTDKVLMDGTTSTYYTKSSASSSVPYYLIDGDETNGETFSYTVGKPVTLRFDFEKTWVTGDNNDRVKVTIYGINDNGEAVYIGEKSYKTEVGAKNYGFRMSDNNSAGLMFDNISIVIDEESEYLPCNGDHGNYWSQCEPKVENLPNNLTVKYACGATEYVDYIVENNITSVLAGESLTLTGDTLTSTATGKTLGFSTYTGTLTTSASYVNPSAEHNFIRICGRDVLRIDTEGNLVTYSDDASATSDGTDTTPQKLGVTLGVSKSYALKIVTRPVSGFTYDIDFYIDGELKGTERITAVETSSKFVVTKYATAANVSLAYISGTPRLTVNNDFFVAADINTSKTYAVPTADSPIISLGGKSLLTLNTEGQLVLAGGEVALNSLKPMRTYAVAVKMIPAFSGFSYAVYIEDEEVGRSQVTFDAATGFTFSAPSNTELNNIKVAHFNTTFPTADIGIKSAENKDATPCVHRDPLAISSTTLGKERKFYTAPLIRNHSSGTTMGVNSLWYSYDCYYCGERIYVSAGSNLYNGTTTYPFEAYKSDNSVDTSITANTMFDGDGVYDSTGAVQYLHTNQNITKSGGPNFWINLTYTLKPTDDGKLNISSWGSMVDSNGFSLLAVYQSGSRSMLRLWAIEPNDTDGYPVTDDTPVSKVTPVLTAGSTNYSDTYYLIGFGSSAQTARYAIIRAGMSLNFTFHVDPGSSATRAWCNGELVANNVTQTGNGGITHGYSLRVFEKTFGAMTLSNFAFILDEPAAAEAHTHTDEFAATEKRVTFSDDKLNYLYTCYCGANVTETIATAVENNISNFYDGYGKVEFTAPEDKNYWVDTDINIKKGGLSGSLIKIGDKTVLSVSDLENITAPTSVNAAVRVIDGSLAKVYINSYYIHSVTLDDKVNSVTFGEDNTYNSYVTFKYNKIVTLAQNVETAPTITFDDQPEGAICYHENSTHSFADKDSLYTAPTGGYSFTDDETNYVQGMKNLKVRYICTKCGEAVYAVQGDPVEVNFKPNSDYDKNSATELVVNEDGSATFNRNSLVVTSVADMGRGSSYWLSFDLDVTTLNTDSLMASKKSSGGSMLALIYDAGTLTTANGAYSFLQLLRGYSVLRPDAEAENGVYDTEDYYDDRIGIYHTSETAMAAQYEGSYEFVIKEGNSYRIEFCFEKASDTRTIYSIYVDGKRVYAGGSYSHEGFDAARLENETALAGIMQYPTSFRFMDGSYGTFGLRNLSVVKRSAGNDDYSENTSVFEMSVTKPAEDETLASINGVELLSATADGQLTIGETTLYKKADGIMSPVTLTDTASKLAIVYCNGTARYYIDEDLAFIGETDNVTADIAVGDTDLSATTLTVGSTVTVNDIYGVGGDADADYITFQEGVDTLFNNEIRILSGVDMLYYNRVGYRIITDNNGTVTSSMKKSLSVYSSVVENVGGTANTIDAARYGHRYYSLLNISDLANNDAANEYYLYVTPFTMIDDDIVYSAKTAKITVTKGTQNSYAHEIVSTNTVPDTTVTETVVE